MSKTSTRRAWTEAEVATLRDLHAQGASIKEMVAATGKSVGSVSTKLMRLGLADRKPPWTTEEIVILWEMVEAEVPHEEQCVRLGRSHSAVSRKRQSLGLGRWRQQPRHDLAAKLDVLLDDVTTMLRAKRSPAEILEFIYSERSSG
jgi:hypothetical protein